MRLIGYARLENASLINTLNITVENYQKYPQAIFSQTLYRTTKIDFNFFLKYFKATIRKL